MKNFLNQIKFIISKINVYLRYKKQSISYGIKWILFGKEISNFTYEIKNEKELLHIVQIITGIDYEVLKKILSEINFDDNQFKNFLSDDFYSNYSKKKIFGRRLLWFLLIRTLKPDLVIESGVDKKLGSAILIYGLFKNYLEGYNNSEFIGLDIENNKKGIWSKLTKTEKIKKIKQYVNDILKPEYTLTDDEINLTIKLFNVMIERKKLSKNNELTYNQENGFIEQIGGLTFNTETRRFNINIDNKNSKTKKNK
jgi:hypothetical protein